jgi:hypothetical protein
MLNFWASPDSLMRNHLAPRRNNTVAKNSFPQVARGIAVATLLVIGNVAFGRAKALIVQAVERLCFCWVRRSLWFGVTKKQSPEEY